MKHLFIAFVLIITTSYFVAGQRKPKKSTFVPQTVKYQAVVDKNEAVFTFPLKPSQRYEFCSRGLRYVWSVEVNSDSQDFEFGYFLSPKWEFSSCGQGNIQKLLRKGQFSLFKRKSEDTSTEYTVVTGLTAEGFVTYDNFSDESLIEKPIVSGFASSNKLTIKLSGTKSLQLLFANQPKYLNFTTQTLENNKNVSVLVTYTAKFLSAKKPSTQNDNVNK